MSGEEEVVVVPEENPSGDSGSDEVQPADSVADSNQTGDASTDTVEEFSRYSHEFGSEKVELWWQIVVVASNWVAFLICIAMNASSQSFMEFTLRDITDEWANQIAPSGFAFSIWGLIYTLLGGFLVYQTLPAGWVPDRNDNMIYNQMNLLFALNMIGNAAWLPLFQSNTNWGFIVSEILILFILVTNLAIMTIADRNVVYWPEVFFVRLPFSIYTGWISAATILNTSFMLKSWGMSDAATASKPKNPKAWDFLQDLVTPDFGEEEWAIMIDVIALIIYEIAAWSERNPVFGGVFIWASAAILDDLLKTKPESEKLIATVGTTIGIHSISMIVMTVYLIFEEFQPWYKPLSFWGGGIIGFTDWARMFTDLNHIWEAGAKYFKGVYQDRMTNVFLP